MKKTIYFIVILSTLAPTQPAVTTGRPVQTSANPVRRHEGSIPGSYIVVLKPEVGAARVAPVARELASAHGGRLAAVYRHALRGFSVRMAEKAADAVSRHPLVEYVEEDAVVETAAVQHNAPWGLDRVDQRDLPLSTTYAYASTGAGVRAYVIDSGIRTTHDEFEGRAAVAFDNVGDGRNGEDCLGHGTKVASVVGGRTFGVAKGVQLRAVRVFNCLNRTNLTQLLDGVDWVTANHEKPAVAVLSVAAPGSSALDAAVQNSIAAGVPYVVAAGNTNADAGTRSPARVPEALTVGATDQADTRATFSNSGAVLDLFAPGVDIAAASHFDDTAAALESGTSMAAAHAAGVVARYLEVNNSASPAAVNQALIAHATPDKVINPGAGSPNLLLHFREMLGVIATKVDSYPSSPNGAQPGETITYEVFIANENTSDITNATFVDTLDPNTTLVPGSVSCANAAVSGDTLTCNIGTLAAGHNVTITFQVTLDSPYTGGPSVSNQGSFTDGGGLTVLTDDPGRPGASEPTMTPVAAPPDIAVNDAFAPEPASVSTPMVFTVVLSSPAPAGGVTVNFTTADGLAQAGADYVATAGTLAFTAGQRVQTISVPVLRDTLPESDETFFVNLWAATGGIVTDDQATGAITAANPAGAVVISELRTVGPGGAGDDFVEVYNNSPSPHMVSDAAGGAGYGLFRMGATCDDTPVLVGVIPNGTVIPARGHLLIVGSQYSLGGAAAGDLTMTADLGENGNVGLFSTSEVASLSALTRLDAAGFGHHAGNNCDLLREGDTLPAVDSSAAGPAQHSFYRSTCSFVPGVGCTVPNPGSPGDRNDNAADFLFVADDATAAAGPSWQRLGAPGPSNLASPRVNDSVSVFLLDSSKSAAQAPNRVRDLGDTGPNKTFGTLSIRRRVTNHTGGDITRLRFRIVDITSFPRASTSAADLRALSSTSVSVAGVIDAATCGSQSAPCTVIAQGTTLEEPPAQPNGGAYNSTLAAGTVTLATPLANGASINLQFLLGVEQTGTLRFLINVEALP